MTLLFRRFSDCPPNICWNAATAEIISSTTKTVFDFATGDKNFDEAKRELATQSTGAIKTIIIERGSIVIEQEAQRLGNELAEQAKQKIIKKIGGSNNPVLNAIAFGDIVKDLALDWADGKISDEQFVKLVARRCTVLALQWRSAWRFFRKFALMDVMNAGLDAAADRRKVISKTKQTRLPK